MFFIPNLRRGVSVVGIIVAIGLPWLLANLQEIRSGKGKDMVSVPAAMQVCTTHEDCGYVETACSSCCHYEPVNKSQEKAFYKDHFGPACMEYNGAVCDCVSAEQRPLCVKGRCVLAPPPPVYND